MLVNFIQMARPFHVVNFIHVGTFNLYQFHLIRNFYLYCPRFIHVMGLNLHDSISSMSTFIFHALYFINLESLMCW
jgi:hypothetical protein